LCILFFRGGVPWKKRKGDKKRQGGEKKRSGILSPTKGHLGGVKTLMYIHGVYNCLHWRKREGRKKGGVIMSTGEKKGGKRRKFSSTKRGGKISIRPHVIVKEEGKEKKK